MLRWNRFKLYLYNLIFKKIVLRRLNIEEKDPEKVKESNNVKNSYLIKEDEEIIENISNNNDNKNINEKVESEKNKIDKDDEFVSIF